MAELPNGEEVKWSALSRRARREERALNRKPLGTRIIDMYRWVNDSHTPIWGAVVLWAFTIFGGGGAIVGLIMLIVQAFIHSVLLGWVVLVVTVFFPVMFVLRMIDREAQKWKGR